MRTNTGEFIVTTSVHYMCGLWRKQVRAPGEGGRGVEEALGQNMDVCGRGGQGDIEGAARPRPTRGLRTQHPHPYLGGLLVNDGRQCIGLLTPLGVATLLGELLQHRQCGEHLRGPGGGGGAQFRWRRTK
jgi:hypothetical protein